MKIIDLMVENGKREFGLGRKKCFFLIKKYIHNAVCLGWLNLCVRSISTSRVEKVVVAGG